MIKKSVLLVVSVLSLAILVGLNFVSATPSVALTDYNATLAQVTVATAPNIYAYEVNMDYNGAIGSMQSYNFLANDSTSPIDITNGHNEGTDSIGTFSSVYESRLDSTLTAACINAGCTGLLFNLTHIGTISIRYAVFVDKYGAETYVYYNSTDTTTDPDSTTIIVSGGGGTVIEQYGLKIVIPGDIIISDSNYIEVPLIIRNPGEVSLTGINLSAKVTFNDEPTGDVSIVLAQQSIVEILPGNSENVTIRVYADTSKFGKYKVTLYVNVASPKISDYGDFYIELKKVEASDAEQHLIFAEKLISTNPKCLELTEVVNDARKLLDEGDYRTTIGKSKEAVNACEAILKEAQIMRIKSYMPYIYAGVLAALIIFLISLIVYIYRKSKHRKSKSYY